MKRNLLIVILALQSAWLLGTVFVQECALREGTVVLLETRPVDPRDLLRGDYVILNYNISTIATNLFSPALTNTLPYGQTVWVALASRGEFHEVVRASLVRFEPGEGEVASQRLALIMGWSVTSSVKAPVSHAASSPCKPSFPPRVARASSKCFWMVCRMQRR